MNRGEECGAVFTDSAGLDRYKAWKVLVFRSQTVAYPGAHRGADFSKGACVKLQRCAGMLRIVRIHASEEADIVGDACEMRHQV